MNPTFIRKLGNSEQITFKSNNLSYKCQMQTLIYYVTPI